MSKMLSTSFRMANCWVTGWMKLSKNGMSRRKDSMRKQDCLMTISLQWLKMMNQDDFDEITQMLLE
uniref:Uncharacterized protein n=1 Tax=Arundo donax TaxID=35708 RepID=A0A0A9A058_ARUDO